MSKPICLAFKWQKILANISGCHKKLLKLYYFNKY